MSDQERWQAADIKQMRAAYEAELATLRQQLESARAEIRKHNEGLDAKALIDAATDTLQRTLHRQGNELTALRQQLEAERQYGAACDVVMKRQETELEEACAKLEAERARIAELEAALGKIEGLAHFGGRPLSSRGHKYSVEHDECGPCIARDALKPQETP